MIDKLDDTITFYDLKWDTDFFGVKSAKAILQNSLTLKEWNVLKASFKDYQFISIDNRNSDPVNAYLIGKETSSFLVDVNIQFNKNLTDSKEKPKNITVYQALEPNEQVIDLTDFQFSKFTEDTELAKRGGNQVYKQWIINSFKKPDKFYAISKDENDRINGYLLFSYSNNVCVIELIAVSKTSSKSGIGSSLFAAVEYEAYQRGINEINVGTQIRNIGAINFYYKVGCKQVGCHQVYHLWNL